MDYRIYHAINLFVLHHPWLGRAFADVETVTPILVGAAAFSLWLLARPGANGRWKLASASALASGALALFIRPSQHATCMFPIPRPTDTVCRHQLGCPRVPLVSVVYEAGSSRCLGHDSMT